MTTTGFAGSAGTVLPGRDVCVADECRLREALRSTAETLERLDDPTNKPGWQSGAAAVVGLDGDGNVGWFPPLAIQWPAFGQAIIGGGGNDPGGGGAWRFDGDSDPEDVGGADGDDVPNIFPQGKFWWLDVLDVLDRDDDNAWIFPWVIKFPVVDLGFLILVKRPDNQPYGPVSSWGKAHPIELDEDFTIIIWFSCDSNTSDRGILDVWDDGGTYYAIQVWFGSDGHLYVGIQILGYGTLTLDLGAVSTGVKYYLAIRWDQSATTLTVDLVPSTSGWDARTTQTGNQSGVIWATGDPIFQLGGFYVDGTQCTAPFSGYIAQVVIVQDWWHNDQLEWFFNGGSGRKDF